VTDDLAPLRQTLADLLAVLREDAGLSQQQLADRVGYSRVTVATAESRRRQPAEGFWTRADAALAADGELIRGCDRLRWLGTNGPGGRRLTACTRWRTRFDSRSSKAPSRECLRQEGFLPPGGRRNLADPRTSCSRAAASRPAGRPAVNMTLRARIRPDGPTSRSAVLVDVPSRY
jgi:Helix-turn-helix domain